MGTRRGPRLPASRWPLIALASVCAVLAPASAGIAPAEAAAVLRAPEPPGASGAPTSPEVSARVSGSLRQPRVSAEVAGSLRLSGLHLAACLQAGPLAGLVATVEIGMCRAIPPALASPPAPTPTVAPPAPSSAPSPAPPRPADPPPSMREVPRPVPSRLTVPPTPPRREATRRPPEEARPSATPSPSASPVRRSRVKSAPLRERRPLLPTAVIIVVLSSVIAAGVGAAFSVGR